MTLSLVFLVIPVLRDRREIQAMQDSRVYQVLQGSAVSLVQMERKETEEEMDFKVHLDGQALRELLETLEKKELKVSATVEIQALLDCRALLDSGDRLVTH